MEARPQPITLMCAVGRSRQRRYLTVVCCFQVENGEGKGTSDLSTFEPFFSFFKIFFNFLAAFFSAFLPLDFFDISIDPSGSSPGHICPEAANGRSIRGRQLTRPIVALLRSALCDQPGGRT